MSARNNENKADLRVPFFAWPTFLLFLGCAALWGTVLWSVETKQMGFGWGYLLSSFTFYALFTPLHDATHQSISKYRWINEVLGRLSAWMMAGSFVAFRYLHLEHHKYTNDPVKDPDFWSGRAPRWLLPFRWLTQNLFYHSLYYRAVPGRPSAERIEAWVTGGVFLLIMGSLIASGWGWEFLCLWFLPTKTSAAMLAYSFDYLPHKPHKIRSEDDPYSATLIRPNPLLTPLLLCQNFHLIHHLYPAVPFYRYAQVWRIQREELIKKGAQVRPLKGSVLTPHKTQVGAE